MPKNDKKIMAFSGPRRIVVSKDDAKNFAWSSKNTLFKVELVAVVLLLLVIPLLFFRPSITGFVASNTFAQTIDMTMTESQSVVMKSISGPIRLSSILVSGEIVGDGAIAIYLSNLEGQQVLIYTNTISENRKSNAITGYSIGAAYAAEEVTNANAPVTLSIDYGKKLQWPGNFGRATTSGGFTSVCIDSCFLGSDFNRDEFQLLAYVEPGTTLKLTEVFFTVD